MIFCARDALSQYLGFDANLDIALRFAATARLDRLAPGRNEITGDGRVYANRFDYETAPGDELFFEAHAAHADLHLLLAGEEMIQMAGEARRELVKACPEEDYALFRGEEQGAVRMTRADALLLFPGELHKAKCMLDAPRRVEKLVVKIQLCQPLKEREAVS